MKVPSIVLDTNVLVAALRSTKGASFKLLSLIDSEKFQLCLSVPLVLEYEEILFREIDHLTINEQDVQDVLDFLCLVGRHQSIYYLWRPYLRDMDDDFVLEVAVAAECDYIVSFNQRDFKGVDNFGIQVITPKAFLSVIGELS